MSSQRDARELRAEVFLCSRPQHGLFALGGVCCPASPYVVMLHGSVVLCEDKSIDSTNLGENIVLSASGRAARTARLAGGCCSAFLCVLLTASHTKHSRGAKGDSPSFGGKVAACKTQEVCKGQSLSTPTLSNEAQSLFP